MAKRVVLVDDSKTILATVEKALEDMVAKGVIKVKSYVDPSELLKLLQNGQENYDLLISDINMPQLNGLDLARTLKTHTSFKNKPILILTIEDSTDMKAVGKEIGVSGWLVKPFSNEKLVKAINMVLK